MDEPTDAEHRWLDLLVEARTICLSVLAEYRGPAMLGFVGGQAVVLAAELLEAGDTAGAEFVVLTARDWVKQKGLEIELDVEAMRANARLARVAQLDRAAVS